MNGGVLFVFSDFAMISFSCAYRCSQCPMHTHNAMVGVCSTEMESYSSVLPLGSKKARESVFFFQAHRILITF